MSIKKHFYTWQDVDNMTHDILRQVATDRDNFKPDYIVGLCRGGLIPGVMLSHYFDIPFLRWKNCGKCPFGELIQK